MRSLATITQAGIASSEAEIRCPAICGNTPVRKATYTPRVLDATVASPVVNTRNSSDRVIFSRYGRITSADSIPTKMFAALESYSAPLIFIVR